MDKPVPSYWEQRAQVVLAQAAVLMSKAVAEMDWPMARVYAELMVGYIEELEEEMKGE